MCQYLHMRSRKLAKMTENVVICQNFTPVAKKLKARITLDFGKILNRNKKAGISAHKHDKIG